MAQIGAPISSPTSDRRVPTTSVASGDAGQEQQRVARQEEADEQAGLGEHDDPDADQAEGLDQFLGVEGVEREAVGEGAALLGGVHAETGYREGRPGAASARAPVGAAGAA
jgi:hypothetical protein